jgi:serine/threonine-protein kinase
MSPEQARGKPVDSRADVWAFGVVLFEMLTGKSLFAGETVSDTLASVLQREPDWDLLPRAVPPAIRRLLRRCLTKNPRQRLQAVGEARIAIERRQEDARNGIEESSAPTGRSPLASPLLAATAGALAVALAWLLLDGRTGADIPAPLTRFSIETDGSGLRDVGVSPDGSAFFIRTAERTLVRRRDELEGTQVGDRRTITGAFSPDGRWIALYSWDDEILGSGRLQKAPLERGTVVTLPGPRTRCGSGRERKRPGSKRRPGWTTIASSERCGRPGTGRRWRSGWWMREAERFPPWACRATVPPSRPPGISFSCGTTR